MSVRMDETVANFDMDNLINDTYPTGDVFGVTLRAGQGILPRGTLLTKSSTDGMMVLYGTTPTEGEVLTANCILADNMDTGTDANGAGMYTSAYRTGHFNRNSLILKEGASLSQEDEEELRRLGILLDDAMKY